MFRRMGYQRGIARSVGILKESYSLNAKLEAHWFLRLRVAE